MSQVITSQNGICRYCDSITTNQADEFCCLACRTLFESGWSKTAKPSDDLDNLAFSETSYLYNISSSSEKTSYRLSIQGLHCSSCVHLLEDLPKYLTEVVSARVNFPRSELYIDVRSDHSLGKILNFVKEMGYPARPLAPDEDKTAEQIAEDRDLLCRLGVAGACTGNIMLFTVAIYGGLRGNLGFWFNGISFLLFLPIVFYSAIPIYRGAWAALRLKSVNADFSLALALWVGFCASVVNWYRGSGAIYFDSTAGFIFLILISRWFLRTSQRRWANGSISFDHWNRGSFKVQRSGQTKYLPASQLSPEDLVYLRRGMVVPVDGKLESTSALFDTSWMTGESVPRIIQCESNIAAGYRLLSEDCALRVVTSSQDSELMRGLRRIEVEALSQSHRIGTFDRAARILLSSVFIIGLATVLFGPVLGIGFNSAFERALSLLIVACPCALAFGGPLAYGIAIRKAAEKGLLVKSADVFDRVLECTSLVFDKTGTLTTGHLRLIKQTPEQLPDWIKDLILSLEKNSVHPVAFAFREAWTDRLGLFAETSDVHEVAGSRVFGIFDGQMYSVQTGESNSGKLVVELRQGDNQIANFEFEDATRSEAKKLLSSLSQHFTLSLLSGDRISRVKEFIRSIGVNFYVSRGDCRPEDKYQFIKNHPKSLMVGDGINDAQALAAAHVGVVINGPLEHGLRFGSVYFLRPGLEPIYDLFTIAKRARKLVRRNLAFALAYNILAGIAALGGFVNPLVAAVLMPISSFIILASTWEGMR